MTFAEVFVFFAVTVIVYFLLTPLQRRLERYLFKLLLSKTRGSGPVIDITDYSKKDKSK
jgi:hypothetical protein